MGKSVQRAKTEGQKPPSGTEEMVNTPGGPRPKSKVHWIEPGFHVSGKGGRLQKVDRSGRVIEDYGEKIKLAKDAPRRRDFKAAKKTADRVNPAPETGDWIVNSDWTNDSGSPISYFSTTWTVPPAPATDNGQLIYLFNGMQDADDYIFQPVLQWGSSPAGGGSYWSLTSWYAGPIGSGVGLHGTLKKVNTGDVVQGIMTLTGTSGGKFSYLSSFIVNGVAEPDDNSYAVSDIDELNWAIETLECYYFKAFTDYPDTPLTAFHDIEIKVRTQTVPAIVDTEATINWGIQNRHTDNGQKCLIISNDSPGGDVYLYYRTVQQSLYFVTDKSTFGTDEVNDVISKHGGVFNSAFWLILEGFTIDQLTKDQPAAIQPVLSGAFKNFGNAIITTGAAGMQPESPGDLYTPQRIRFPFDIRFTGSNLFPGNNVPLQEALHASISVGGTQLTADTLFELAAGADPYFTNIDPNNNVYYLSQDLRVFSAANGDAPLGGPIFSGSPYDYIQSFLGYLNGNGVFTTPSGLDPLNNLPGQDQYETGDSSVTPLNAANLQNYNFAIARVRLQDVEGAVADKVRVFFRLFVAQSCDTDYQPVTTYPTSTDAAGNLIPIASGTTPDPASQTIQTIPFFATGTAAGDYDGTSANGNVQNIGIPVGQDSIWKYFGCFLDVYNSSNQSKFPGTHHCIVAEINYDSTPIVNSGGVTMSPENSDKLAQRNLQITSSGNPSYPLTHRIPQAFDTRPSPQPAAESGALLDYPDELMIDWGNVPTGSLATIYWPQVNARDVLQLASTLYAASSLSAVDAHTINLKVSSGIGYLPIPPASRQNFAGLFTLELPQGITVGQEFNIQVRRITSRQPPPVINIRAAALKHPPVDDTKKSMQNWRYITGTFQVKIPVAADANQLLPEENTLAVLKWRQQNMSPLNRWYPIVQKQVAFVTGRVAGFGGKPEQIPPTLQGIPAKLKGHEKETRHEGKIAEVIFDCFGDFEGFVLRTCCSKQVLLRSREKAIGELALKACKERLTVIVQMAENDREQICKFIIHC